MNQSSWSSRLPRFKNLLRPDGFEALGEPEEPVESARDEASAALAVLSDTLPDLVFEGRHDWYVYQDDWILRSFGQVLVYEDEREILSRLDTGTRDSLVDLFNYMVDRRLPVWQEAARRD